MNFLSVTRDNKVSIYTIREMNAIQHPQDHRSTVSNDDVKKSKNIGPIALAKRSQGISDFGKRVIFVIERLS
ncbi:hypothetical protein PS854_05447 [Pseudomonas fluorescens]|uniref:Uncharacterized protein n=1 Tax=Pseudomonas fluorescens TaxID=294 RepID=A0A5E7PUU3_PSEFL|nr:hypothetical protein PS854_05447 [Pseudomonas fluorescens]